MNQEHTFIVNGKETNHLPTQGRTLHHTIKLQIDAVSRIHVLLGFDGRPVQMFWYKQHFLPRKHEIIRSYI